jgi:hypothetical protein
MSVADMDLASFPAFPDAAPAPENQRRRDPLEPRLPRNRGPAVRSEGAHRMTATFPDALLALSDALLARRKKLEKYR